MKFRQIVLAIIGAVAAVVLLCFVAQARASAQDNHYLIYGNNSGTVRPFAVGTNGEQIERQIDHFNAFLNPAVNTQATASKAAGGAGVVNVADCVSFSAMTGAVAPAAAVTVVNLRDGATGAGTVLASWDVGFPATAATNFTWGTCGLNVAGSANTAMTLEFAAAGGANTFESVHLTGFTK
jgi:hypothetical protein